MKDTGQVKQPDFAIWVEIIGLVSLLLISSLVQLRILVFTQPMLATIICVLSLFGVPGFLFTRLCLKDDLSLLERMVLAFVLGIGLLILPAGILLLFKGSLDTLLWISITLNGVLFFLYIIHHLRTGERFSVDLAKFAGEISLSRGARIEFLSLFAAFLIIVSFMLFLFINLSPVWDYGDRWTYLPYVRKYLDTSSLDANQTLYKASDARMALTGWLVLQALISKVSGVDPIDTHSLFLPPIWAFLSIIGFYVLAKNLFEDRNMALFATLIQLVYWASTLMPTSWITKEEGFSLFMRINEDKIIAWLFLWPVTLMLFIRYFRHKKKQYLPVIFLSVTTLVFTHVIGFALLGISLISFAIGNVLLNLVVILSGSRSVNNSDPLPPGYSRKTLTQWMIILVMMACLSVVPLLARETLKEAGVSVLSSELSASAYNISRLREHHLLIFQVDRYMASLSLINNPFIILAISLTPLLFLWDHKSLAVRFLCSNMIIPLLVIYNPWTAPWLGQLITPWMIWRIPRVLPIALVIGFVLYKLIELLRQNCAKAQSPTIQGFSSYLSILPLSIMILFAIISRGEIKQGVDYLQAQYRHHSLNRDERDMLNHLDHLSTPGDIVLANEIINPHSRTFSAKIRTLTFNSWKLDPAVTKNIEQFFQSELVNDFIINILELYNVRYIVIESQSPLATQLKLLPVMFSLAYQNDTYTIFKITTDLHLTPLFTANTDLEQGKLDKAIATYKELLTTTPNDPLVHFGLARAYQLKNQLPEAIAEYEKTITLRPDNIWPYLYLVEVYLAEGQTPQSNEAYQKMNSICRQIFTLAPAHPAAQTAILAAYSVLGDSYIEPNLITEIIDSYEKAIELDPDNLQRYDELAEAYKQLGQLDKAVEVYQRAVIYWPAWVEAYLQLGQSYELEGQLSAAAQAYQQALNLNPTLVSPHLLLGNIYLTTSDRSAAGQSSVLTQSPENDNVQAAIAEFQQAVELEPDNADASRYLSQAYKLAGQPEKAVEVYKQAITADGTKTWAYLGLGDLYLAEGKREQAITVYRQALEVGLINSGIYLRLTRLYRESEDYKQALKYAQQALKLSQATSTSGQVHMELGRIYQAQQRQAEALAEFLLAIQNDPNNAWFQATLGDFYYWQQGQPEQALPYYRQAIAMDPDQAWYYVALGRILLTLGNQQEGIKVLETGFSLANDNPDIYLALGRLAAEYHNWPQVIKIYEKALSQGIVNLDIYIELGDAYRELGQNELAKHHFQQAAKLAPDNSKLQQRLQAIP